MAAADLGHMDQPHTLNMVADVGTATMVAQVDDFEVPGETGGAQKDIDGPSSYQYQSKEKRDRMRMEADPRRKIELDAPGLSIHLPLEIATGNGPQSDPEDGQLAPAGNYAVFLAWVKRILAFLIGCIAVVSFGLKIYEFATGEEQ